MPSYHASIKLAGPLWICGLLHDVGKLLLARQQSEAFETAIEVMQDAVDFWTTAGKRLVIVIGVNDPSIAPQLPEISPA